MYYGDSQVCQAYLERQKHQLQQLTMADRRFRLLGHTHSEWLCLSQHTAHGARPEMLDVSALHIFTCC